ncbi:MAG: hypothetical protein JNL38_24655 [Myxococcales bacterium]|jgi:hypothetical protein|nr:hypothetical protein [Myxococcales bacterium]
MNLVDELHAVSRALSDAGIPYAICGGVAVTIHGATRTTKDIDLLVAPEDVPRALLAVRPLGYTYVALPMAFDAGTPNERRVQRVSKLEDGTSVSLDLLHESGGLAGALSDRIHLELPEGPLFVVSRATLERMKRLAGRAQDLADLEKLEHPDDD